ncbi:hypothetical protein PUR59_04180 [Streptomyces sp. SP18ES09]|uniref:hypothetical protein n=1 Tax=Streptomyces sp. SP18ES09 TaxID=3002532 RepID=UPI002E793F86|nr:hypothetical protein [Streptomyces sp. SP18ES09]MEE1814218.1 hypothetical protein [Streptomyces sp. SP18ES09]
MIVLADGAQPLTPTGPYYTPNQLGDEVSAYLAAVRLVPAPQVTGEPPHVPVPPAGGDSPGIVF